VPSASVELGGYPLHLLNRFAVVLFDDLVRLGEQRPVLLVELGRQGNIS